MTNLATWFQVIYVNIMIWLIGRLLEAASKVDSEIQGEINELPGAFAFSMGVFPNGPAFAVSKQADGAFFCRPRKDPTPADLEIVFKHVRHAFLVFSFQESTARSFANDRMLLHGEIHLAMIMVRCLDRMECLVLPKFVAKRAVKRYPAIALAEKLKLGTRVYFQVLVGLFRSRHV